ncbi:MAG: glycosyltransferase family 39 protein [Lachnospiraceae bacterium]|nr:glycosyltransferase family 39 protein [Butyrivibrio sp.]MCM1343139.1 glycosyltransferase family 39 protein [Muribaculaceae bacterium]MCM1411547.1 glycosyltransferase family 39 protein [Lachnospiraceae bacterium]
MDNRAEKAITYFYRTGNRVVKIVGGVIFLLLTWYSFRYTYYMEPGGDEIPVNMVDSMRGNLLALAAALAVLVVLMILENHTDRRVQMIVRRVTLLVAMLWVGAVSLWWIFSADRIPEGDQAFIYGGASYFIEGDFAFLSAPSAYCGFYPHQLGLIALMELLFDIVGTYNYQAFEYLCAAMAVGIVYLGYRVISELTDSTAAVVAYDLLMLGCLPLIFYTPWVYGDVPSIFFALLAGWMILQYSRKEKIRYLILTACAVVLSVLVRKHTLILIVAFGIAAVMYALKRKNWKIVVAFLLTAALSYGAYQGIYKMYEVRSGYQHYKGIPISAWLAMGMQESKGRYGWYNGYPKQVLSDLDYDFDKAAQAAKEEMRARMLVFRENPEYTRMFYREKILSQWNQPLYQSIYFNTKYTENLEPAEGTLAARMSGDLYFMALAISNRLQFIVFFGMMCYFFFAVEKDDNILRHVLAVTFIGGFLFSVVFEAKSRYILPYYVMMFPFAVYGAEQAVRKIAYAFLKIYQRIQYKLPQKAYVSQEEYMPREEYASQEEYVQQ